MATGAPSPEAALILAALQESAYLDSMRMPLCVGTLPPGERPAVIEVLPDYAALRDISEEDFAALRLARSNAHPWSVCEPDPATSLLDSWLHTGSRLRSGAVPAVTLWVNTPIARDDSIARSIVAYTGSQQREGFWCTAVQRADAWHPVGCERQW